MDWYYYIAWIIIISQIPIMVLAVHNYRFSLAKSKTRRVHYKPKVALLVPCRNLDRNFEQNITSLFNQDYDDYTLLFVVGDAADPAYKALCQLKEKLSTQSKVKDAQILIAGPAEGCGQKIHNLLFAYKHIAEDTEVLAFADSDICVRQDWLRMLVNPLRHEKNGLSSGYRWFVPEANNTATLALSAINAKVAQLLGNTRCNQAWGGSMAVKVETFAELGMEKIWQSSVSDDYSLSRAVRSMRKKIEFVPRCLVASYEKTTWPRLFEFARRQFVITKVFAGRTWWFGFLTSMYSVVGLWATFILGIYAALTGALNAGLYIAVPIIFFGSQMSRAVLRQSMAGILLKEHRPNLKVAAVADILFFWAWSILLFAIILSSVFGRTICWRGIKYKLVSPAETIIVKH